MKKALFFLRHYNDIDHITPVIVKWVESGNSCDIVLLKKTKLTDDFRIQFLNTLNGVRIARLFEILPLHEFLRWQLQTILLNQRLRRSFFGTWMNALSSIYDINKRLRIWNTVSKRLLKRSFSDQTSGVIVFDWITRNSPISLEWVETIAAMAHTKGLGAVSLPHGDSPHASQLIRHGEWQLAPDDMYCAGRIFDKLVVPNTLCATRFQPFMNETSLAILGSPRYCDEWLLRLKTIIPSSPLKDSDNRLKIVFFLRKNDFTIFWEEVGEVIHMIASFPGTELIIKPHTRGGWRQSLTRDRSLLNHQNVHVAEDNTHSTHLMNWGDVMIDLATSVVFEAVKAGKPVLAADYLHAGKSTIATYMPETELRCRDDVYNKIDTFLKKGCNSFYVEAHRQRFIKEIIDGPDTDTLSRYVALLEEVIAARSESRPRQENR
ncbi:hypothetical protein [Nitrosomonas sp.]|uniref:hypothetical protein n=1 Tax=Nitrosomonas sp. TaxID=42353 RepID=UPI00284443C5|nr:hypothetical protein [Nitrosomonas sp.]MCP5242266.1 hypothetical protein [Burkholderiales bacterium]MDR4514152.1 hypothetical protein [Nitrosomonas sp.]